MSALASLVKRGVVSKPLRGLVYGVEGVGKTTFAAGAPNPIFLGNEDGLGRLGCARFDTVRKWQDVKSNVRLLLNEEHEYQTLVVDTIDHLESLVWAYTCAAGGKSSIEDFGYAKGYVAAMEEWRLFARDLEALRDKGMASIILAHCKVAKTKNPDGIDYDRYEIPLYRSNNVDTPGFFKQWADYVLFATFKTFVTSDKKGDKPKAFGGEQRIAHTSHGAVWDAKNRLGLPKEISFDYPTFEREAFGADAAKERAARLRADIASALEVIADADLSSKTDAWLQKADHSVAQLSEALNRLQSRLPREQS